jgi:hypothetical protein
MTASTMTFRAVWRALGCALAAGDVEAARRMLDLLRRPA